MQTITLPEISKNFFRGISSLKHDLSCFRSITIEKSSRNLLGFVLLFLVSITSMNAQTFPPCIDGNSEDWSSADLQNHPNYSHETDVFTGNQDDIYTGSKDFKLFGPNNNDSDYNEWTLSPMQAKSDIMNAAAVVLTGVETADGCTGSFGEYDPTHTYLFFAGDRQSNNGTGYTGFWFLIDGSTAKVDNGQNVFDPPHNGDKTNPGDLLILVILKVVVEMQWLQFSNG